MCHPAGIEMPSIKAGSPAGNSTTQPGSCGNPNAVANQGTGEFAPPQAAWIDIHVDRTIWRAPHARRVRDLLVRRERSLDQGFSLHVVPPKNDVANDHQSAKVVRAL